MTPEQLVDVHLLTRLKHTYCRLLDTKQFEELAALFVPDGTTSYGGGAITLTGREAISGYLTKAMGAPTMLTSHVASMPEIDLDPTDPDRATGTWALRDVVIFEDFGLAIRGASYYADRYVRVDGRWMIEHTGYRRLYEEIGPRGESTRTTASWWSTDGVSSLVGPLD